MSTVGKCLERYRLPLENLGRRHVQGALEVKVDVCGVVQQTLLECFLHRADWQPLNDKRRTGWVRRVFMNNLYDEVRRYQRQSRDCTREFSLEAWDDGRRDSFRHWLVCSQRQPVDNAIAGEQVRHVRSALKRLPGMQRKAIELHYLQGLTLAETAKHLAITKGASAGLIYRGLQKMRRLVRDLVELQP